jgi:hypothetical protein
MHADDAMTMTRSESYPTGERGGDDGGDAMFIMFGTQFYGKVDHVPGLFYVSTRFAHLNYVPLAPTGSYLILDGSESGDNYRGVSIGLSAKSVVMGYLRAAMFLGGLVLAGFSIAEIGHNPTVGFALIAGAVLLIPLFILSYRLTRPGPERALGLAQQAGIPPEVVAKHFVKHNLIPEQAHESDQYA